MSKFAVVTNRGAQLAVFNTEAEADAFAVKVESPGVFAWSVKVPDSTQEQDMPGRGVIYG